MAEDSVKIGGPESLTWDEARRRVLYSRVRVWPKLQELFNRGGEESLKKLLIRLARTDPAEQTLRLELGETLIHFGIVRMLSALTELATEHGAPWVEMRPPPAHELHRGPQALNTATAVGWRFPGAGGPGGGDEVASHPVMVLKHRPGSTSQRLAMRASMGTMVLDPPQPTNVEGRTWSVGAPRLQVVHFDYVCSSDSVAEWGPWLAALVDPTRQISPPPERDLLDDDPDAPLNALDVGATGVEFMYALHSLIQSTDETLDDVVAQVGFRLVSLLTYALPIAVERSGLTVVPSLQPVGDGQATPLGWVINLHGDLQSPQLDTLRGSASFFVSRRSLVGIRAALRALLRGERLSAEFSHPEGSAPLAPGFTVVPPDLESPRPDGSSSGPTTPPPGARELPDVGELLSLIACEFAEADRDLRGPFVTLDRRIRLGRLSQHMAHVAVPAGVVMRFADQPFGELKVALDGEFSQELHPCVYTEVHLPYDGKQHELRLRWTARTAGPYTDLAAILEVFKELRKEYRAHQQAAQS